MISAQEILSEYKYKVELHAHTRPASGCSNFSPESAVRIYSSIGYDGLAVTNHFEKHLNGGSPEETTAKVAGWYSDYERAEKAGAALGLKTYLGAELRFFANSNDYLLFGFPKEDLEEILHLISTTDLNGFRRAYHRDGTLLIWAHPMRGGILDVELDLVDAIEVYNMHPYHNGSQGSAAVRFGGLGKPLTCGSDFHDPGAQGTTAMNFRRLPEDSSDLAELIRSGDYVMSVGKTVILA